MSNVYFFSSLCTPKRTTDLPGVSSPHSACTALIVDNFAEDVVSTLSWAQSHQVSCVSV